MPKTLTRLIGKRFNLQSSEHISAAAFRNIRDYICGHYDKGLGFVEPILCDVGTALTITNKKDCPAGVTGTFAKRLATAFHKAGVDISDSDKARIGEMANRWNTKNTLYGVVVDKINWDSGDFGDGGSCFWSDRSIARSIIPLNGGGAVTLYSDINMEDGAGRCLILPLPDLGYALFNAYGLASLEAIAAGMAATFETGVPYPVDLTERGEWRGDDFWINGGKGIILPTVDTQVREVDLDLDRPRRCARCHDYEGHATFDGDNIYCTRCAPRLCRCSRCDKEGFDFDTDPVILGQHICPQCYEIAYPSCALCDEHYKPGTLLQPKRGRYWFSDRMVCPRCARRHSLDLEPKTDEPQTPPSATDTARLYQEALDELTRRSNEALRPTLNISTWASTGTTEPAPRFVVRPTRNPNISWFDLPDFFTDEEDESESE